MLRQPEATRRDLIFGQRRPHRALTRLRRDHRDDGAEERNLAARPGQKQPTKRFGHWPAGRAAHTSYRVPAQASRQQKARQSVAFRHGSIPLHQ